MIDIKLPLSWVNGVLCETPTPMLVFNTAGENEHVGILINEVTVELYGTYKETSESFIAGLVLHGDISKMLWIYYKEDISNLPNWEELKALTASADYEVVEPDEINIPSGKYFIDISEAKNPDDITRIVFEYLQKYKCHLLNYSGDLLGDVDKMRVCARSGSAVTINQ